ncbi:17711_t:CDS:2, partial [Racocetra fulgida]
DKEANKNKQLKKSKQKANNASDKESSNQSVTNVEVNRNKQDSDTDNENFLTNNEISALLKRLETLEKLQAAQDVETSSTLNNTNNACLTSSSCTTPLIALQHQNTNHITQNISQNSTIEPSSRSDRRSQNSDCNLRNQSNMPTKGQSLKMPGKTKTN